MPDDQAGETKSNPATEIVASQKTLSEAVGATKNVTITTDPADADDSADVIKAATAASSDDTIATVTANASGGFDIVGVKEGTANITFTSGTFTVTLAVTITAAS